MNPHGRAADGVALVRLPADAALATSRRADLVVLALRQPERLPSLPLAQWDLLVRQARRADLLARIGSLLDERGLLPQVPAAPRSHLEAARVFAQAQQDEARREVAHIERAVQGLGIPLVLLKGAAYVLAGLPAALGRSFDDVDVLVPRALLPHVESRLMLNGWATTHHTPYDQRYYREWMHELPPMRHIARQTVVDVHHAILPLTARSKPDSGKLIAAARSIGGSLAVLAPADLVLHSMTHLLHNDELSHGLRDLSDIDLLLRHFGSEPSFWSTLVQRAHELDLRRPLYYGLRCAERVLGTPVPAAASAAIASAAPPAPLRPLMDTLWTASLGESHRAPSAALPSTCRFLLYLRAHWLRMPPGLLLRHLTIKALRRPEADAKG